MLKKLINKYNNLSVAAKASLWAFLANLIQRGVSIIATPIFTRILTTDEYAQYTLYQSWHDIFIIFVSLNVFNYATYSGFNKYDKDKDGFIATAQTLVTGLSIICFAIYYIINIISGDVLGFPLPIVIIMFFDMLFLSSFNLWTAKERYEFRYKLTTILSIIIGVMGPILGFIAIHYLNSKTYGRIYGVAVVNIVIGLIIYIYNFSKSKNKFDKKYIKFIFAYCIPLIPHFLASQVLTRFDRIMIDKMVGKTETAIYSLAYSLSSLLMIVNDAILKSLTPLTYQIIKEKNNLQKLKKTANYLCILVAVANMLLILFAPEAVKIFATSEYYEAIYIIPPVSASVYFMFLFYIFSNIEYYFSETKYVAKASILAAVLNLVLNWIFIKQYGYLAAGYTTLFSYIVYTMGHYIFMRKVSKKHSEGIHYYDEKSIFIISLIFLIVTFLILFLYKFTIIRYILILVIITILLSKYKDIKKLLNKSQ